MNAEAIIGQAEKLHAQAALTVRNILYRYDGKTYLIDFINGVMEIRCDGVWLVSFNTRSLSVCKRWLREWLAN